MFEKLSSKVARFIISKIVEKWIKKKANSTTVKVQLDDFDCICSNGVVTMKVKGQMEMSEEEFNKMIEEL